MLAFLRPSSWCRSCKGSRHSSRTSLGFMETWGIQVHKRKHDDGDTDTDFVADRPPPKSPQSQLSRLQLSRHACMIGVCFSLSLCVLALIWVVWAACHNEDFISHQLQLMEPSDPTWFPPQRLDSNAFHVIFFGDSRARMWPAPSEGWPGVQFWNRGIGGNTVIDCLRRWDAHIMRLLVTMPAHHRTVLVLQVGINDLKNVLLFPDNTTKIVEETTRQLRRLIDIAARRFEVLVTTVFPTGSASLFSMQRLSWRHKTVAQAIEEVNQYLRTSLPPNVLVFDAARLLASSDGTLVDPKYQKDVLHINNEGYALLNQRLVPILVKMFASQT